MIVVVATITTSAIDLTPFGFTPTESSVYATLLGLGPSTGYAAARATGVARANAYAALEGLARRGAALRTAGRPARYRATDPQVLLIQLAAEQSERLERLTQDHFQDLDPSPSPDGRLVVFASDRGPRGLAGAMGSAYMALTSLGMILRPKALAGC